jgi:hypothetical protein
MRGDDDDDDDVIESPVNDPMIELPAGPLAQVSTQREQQADDFDALDADRWIG